MMRNVIESQQNGLRILETLECGHTNDCVNPSVDGRVECIQCDIDVADVLKSIQGATLLVSRLKEFVEDGEE